jgi:chemotaxis protein MotB
METHGLRPAQVAQVRGFADRQLRHPDNPESPTNRRISVIVQYMKTPAKADSPESEMKDSQNKDTQKPDTHKKAGPPKKS